MEILLNGWILPIGRASSGRVCAYSLRSRLIWRFIYISNSGLLKKPISKYCWRLTIVLIIATYSVIEIHCSKPVKFWRFASNKLIELENHGNVIKLKGATHQYNLINICCIQKNLTKNLGMKNAFKICSYLMRTIPKA